MKKAERINHLLTIARHYREQLGAIAAEFADLHVSRPGSCDGEDLMGCIYDGNDYTETLLRIRNRRAKRSPNKKGRQ
jgi:hypothetical protein